MFLMLHPHKILRRTKISIMSLFSSAHAQTHPTYTWHATSIRGSSIMSMFNFTVYCQTCGKTLVPWRIHQVSPPNITFCGFYHREATRFIEGCNRMAELELSKVFFGRCREALDLVDSEMMVLEMASVCGPYTKFIIEQTGEPPRKQNESCDYIL